MAPEKIGERAAILVVVALALFVILTFAPHLIASTA
jgi:hypothetical protein